MTVIRSTIDDNEVLTDITKKSKAYWGYADEQMENWSELLTITKSYIESNKVYKLLMDNAIVGYYSYIDLEDGVIKLDNLFILPEYIGRGLGKLLMNDLMDKLKMTKIKKVVLDAEPNAEKFYEKFGFTKVGQIETTVKDRYLPVMEYKVNIE